MRHRRLSKTLLQLYIDSVLVNQQQKGNQKSLAENMISFVRKKYNIKNVAF